jgi:hypothetical protein
VGDSLLTKLSKLVGDIVLTKLTKLGTVYKLLSQWETAREYLRRSLTLKQKLFGATHPSTQLGEKLYQVPIIHSN